MTEAYAFLFQRLGEFPDAIACDLSREQSSELLRRAELLRLYLRRRYAAKFLYESLVFSLPSGAAMAGAYSETFGYHMGLRHRPEEYLSEIDIGFYCVNYLRAWALEDLLRRHLESEFGRSWRNQAQVYPLLREFWRHGQRYGAEGLARDLGGQELCFDRAALAT